MESGKDADMSSPKVVKQAADLFQVDPYCSNPMYRRPVLAKQESVE